MNDFKNRFIKIGNPINDPENEGKPYYMISNMKADEVIGYVQYYKPWKQYVFTSYESVVWNNECLEFIVKFLKSLKG